MNMMNLESAVQTTVILGFIWGIFSYVVLRPLQASITDLRGLIAQTHSEIHEYRNLIQQLFERLVIVEQSAKSAHRRIDSLERRA